MTTNLKTSLGVICASLTLSSIGFSAPYHMDGASPKKSVEQRGPTSDSCPEQQSRESKLKGLAEAENRKPACNPTDGALKDSPLSPPADIPPADGDTQLK
ncbi:hypothetical protein D3C87_87990 [compost metagenome]